MVNNELRNLMDLYYARYEKLKEEEKEAKENDDLDTMMVSEALQRQCRKMIA